VLLRRDVSGDGFALPAAGVRSSIVVSLCEEAVRLGKGRLSDYL